MAIQIGTVDGLITISKDNFNCFISAIHTFSQQGGVAYAVQKGISLGTAFQRYVEPVYTRRTNRFDIASIDTPVHTRAGNEQSPARGTFCRKMGILDINDRSNIFQLTPLALELYRNNITIEEYAFILMTKQGIFNNGIYVQNLFAFIANWFDKNTTLLESDLKSAICGLYGNQDIEKTRIDIILNALSLCKLIVNVGTGKYVLASIPAADIFKDFALHSKNLSQALRDDENNYTDYIGSLDHGIFDIISNKNSHIYSRIYPNLSKYIKQNMDKTHQIIYYGCPGSGKSYEVRRKTNTFNVEGFAGLSSFERQQAYQKYLDEKNGHKKNYKGGGTNIYALTHPKLMGYISSCTEFEINSLFEISNEEDFNAIIEALKGCEAYQNDSITKGSGCHWETGLKSYGEFLKDQIPNTEPRKDAVFRTTFHPDTDYAAFVGCYKPCMNGSVIEYSYMPQVFTNAYIAAWENTKKPVYLVIEEINRGNCAQIFGDLFQLLDRDKATGKSEYPIKADKDLVAHIEKVLGAGHEGIKNGELCLPPNLIIYATMNTSDQSLFPMDSAFKRRWDWEYVPINYSKDIDSGKFVIEIDEHTKYSWVEFLESVNDKIYDATNSEDKQMGNFFIKKSIKANEFVNKVMFYLWNEVCKEEYGTQRNFFRKGKDGKTEFKFTELFGDNQATILKEFITSLGVEPIGKKTEEPAAE